MERGTSRQVRPLPLRPTSAEYKLGINLSYENCLKARINYSEACFTQNFIEQLLTHFEQLILTVLNNPFRSFMDIRFDKVPLGSVKVQLSDINGKIIKVNNYATVNQSTLRFTIGQNILSNGNYILTIYAEGEKVSKQVFKQ